MKITMYELFGMVEDGKAPLKFKVNDEIYEYDEDRDYICRHIGGWTYLYENLNKGYISLNDEVEILEEEKKIPEKLDWNKNDFTYPEGNLMSEETADMLMEIQDKVNFILDYFKSKGDE